MPSPTNQDTPTISVIAPLFNEAPSIETLVAEIEAAMAQVGETFEIILVDDGSTDGTWEVIRRIAAGNPRLIGLRFRINSGQTAAISAGFDRSRGQVIIPIDGDLQNDPADIPLLLAKIAEGYDVVSGWRRWRKDARLTRIIPSALANRIISWVGGVKLHDYGCTLKAYRREVMEGVRLYGEMHRFIPIYASWHGARTAEISVNHRARAHGRSNYGLGRTVKVLLDLMVVKFLADFLHNPIYIFGSAGLVFLLGGFMSGLWAVYRRVFNDEPFIKTPLPLLTVMLLVLGVMVLLVGLLAEITVRTYFESQDKKTYRIKESVNAEDPGEAD